MAADPIYSLLDTAFIGHLGTTELGAVAIGSAAFTASFWLFSFLAYGVTPRVARAVGAGDLDLAAKLGGQALLVSMILGGAVAVIGLAWAGPIVRGLGADGDVAVTAETYLRIRVLSAPAVLIATVGHGWMRGMQDTRTPMLIVTVGALVNAVLDYLFIFVFDFGVAGAAWSTVIGQVGAALVFLGLLARRAGGLGLKPNASMIRSLLLVGVELVVRAGAIVAALTLATAVAARMGVIVLGGWQVAMQIFAFLALTLDSVAIAAQSLVGKALGSGDTAEARSIANRLMTWGALLGIVLGVIVWVTRMPFAGLFSDDPAIVGLAGSLIGGLGLTMPLAAVAFTLDGILIGASDTRFLAYSMVITSAVFAGGLLLSLELDWGYRGLLWALGTWLGLRSVWLGLRLVGPRWTMHA